MLLDLPQPGDNPVEHLPRPALFERNPGGVLPLERACPPCQHLLPTSVAHPEDEFTTLDQTRYRAIHADKALAVYSRRVFRVARQFRRIDANRRSDGARSEV